MFNTGKESILIPKPRNYTCCEFFLSWHMKYIPSFFFFHCATFKILLHLFMCLSIIHTASGVYVPAY